MVTIICEAPDTTTDNEKRIVSGGTDVELSALGLKPPHELGARYHNDTFAAVFASDLKRSCATAEIAFNQRGFKVVRDKRLRECNYGDFTQRSSHEVGPKNQSELKSLFLMAQATRKPLL